MVLAALAIYEEEKEKSDYIIDKAVKTVPLAMESYSPDGIYPEGFSYWGYGTGFQVTMLAAMESALGTDFGLSDNYGFLKSPYFMLYMTAPSGWCYNFCDSGRKIDLNQAMYWFASKNKDTSLLWYECYYLKRLNKYTGNEIEYENALAQLQEMGKLGIVSSDELQPMISAINSLRTSRAAYENAQADITAGDWKSAIGELRKVVQEDSNYTEAQTQLADAVRSYKDELMGELSEFDIDKDYSGAISTLRAGLQVVPDDADFLTKIADYEQKISDEIELTVANIIQNANNAVATNADYQSALAELRDAAKQYPTIASIKDAIADVEATYTSAVFADVDTLVGEKKYDEAITLLNDLKSDLSSDNEVLDKIAEVNDLKPIDLSQVVVIDSQDYDYNSDLYTDSFGNTYDGRHYFYAGSEGYAVYNLEGKFTSFSGLIVANQNTGSSASMDIAIYTDDTLAHATTGFNKRTGAVAFNVDVRGVTKLEIRTDGEGGWSSDRRLSIVNTQLEKQP